VKDQILGSSPSPEEQEEPQLEEELGGRSRDEKGGLHAAAAAKDGTAVLAVGSSDARPLYFWLTRVAANHHHALRPRGHRSNAETARHGTEPTLSQTKSRHGRTGVSSAQTSEIAGKFLLPC
jgi:hypothetical protein